MEATERGHPQRRRSSSGDLFICFTARPSSTWAAKRLAWKSLMSPGRGRDPSPALSASLSRRLRSSGSIKGGQSPMFPSSGAPLPGRKKGCAFEAAEPSSPKVTCIGQVRVRAKKKAESRSRECCGSQSWVHQLPLCFLPCKGGRPKEETAGSVVAKWLLTVQESEEDRPKEVEKLQVGIFVREREEKLEAEDSVSVPPRNALLLMRCRSDPVKMAALANRFWGSPAAEAEMDLLKEESGAELLQEGEEEEDDEEEEAEEESSSPYETKKDKEEESGEKKEAAALCLAGRREEGKQVEEAALCLAERLEEGKEGEEAAILCLAERREEEGKEGEEAALCLAERREEGEEGDINNACRSKEKGRRRGKEKDARRHSFSSERDARRGSFSICKGRRWSFSLEKADLDSSDHEEPLHLSSAEAKKKETALDEETESEKLAACEVKEELPDCLLMMMYEPKLSMEVSRETWVCGNDFLRWRPHSSRSRMRSNAPEPPAPLLSEDVMPDQTKPTSLPPKLQPRAAAVAPYQPLVLTRCKSEPLRSSARLAPDACFWKDRHRPIEAAGIGF